MKRVEVRWSDAAHHHPGDWHDGKVDARAYVKSVGYLLNDTKTHIVLAQSRLEDSYTGVFSIPKSAVLSIKHL